MLVPHLKMLGIRIHSTMTLVNEKNIRKRRKETPEVAYAACHIASGIKTLQFSTYGILIKCLISAGGSHSMKLSGLKP